MHFLWFTKMPWYWILIYYFYFAVLQVTMHFLWFTKIPWYWILINYFHFAVLQVMCCIYLIFLILCNDRNVFVFYFRHIYIYNYNIIIKHNAISIPISMISFQTWSQLASHPDSQYVISVWICVDHFYKFVQNSIWRKWSTELYRQINHYRYY